MSDGIGLLALAIAEWPDRQARADAIADALAITPAPRQAVLEAFITAAQLLAASSCADHHRRQAADLALVAYADHTDA